MQLEIGETSDARSHVLITLYLRNDPCLSRFTGSKCTPFPRPFVQNETLAKRLRFTFNFYHPTFQQKSFRTLLHTHTHTRTRIHRIAAISPARRNSPKLAAGPENCGKAPAQGRAQEGAYDSGVEWFTALPANRKYRWTRHARAGSGLRPRGHKLASSKASVL